MKKLHPTQQKLIDLLKKNVDEPLTIRELQDILDASSTSLVHHHINQLIDKGYLRRNPSNPQDYQVLADSPEKSIAYLNVYGMAQCGPSGSILDGNTVDRIKISSKTLGFPAEEAFVVKARGDSMMPKINTGDLVIAQKSSIAEDGDVVVCVNEGEALIKKLQKIVRSSKEITYNLISLNEKYKPFVAAEDFRVEGIAKGVFSYNL
jgi:repressor LexA